MKKYQIIIWLLFYNCYVFATNFTGTYSFNKGLNKASTTIYVSQYKSDSVFIYITAISGMPDFNTLDFRGIISLSENQGTYQFKDSCKIHLTFQGNILIIKEDTICKLPCSLSAKYKKTSPLLKKSSTIVSDFVEKQGKTKLDSTFIYKVPILETDTIYTFSKNIEVKITDEFKQFYLIELNKKQNEFLWVLKKNIQLLKQ